MDRSHARAACRVLFFRLMVSPVIIDALDIVGVSVGPDETETPLVVDQPGA
jgi:hypothetical protein